MSRILKWLLLGFVTLSLFVLVLKNAGSAGSSQAVEPLTKAVAPGLAASDVSQQPGTAGGEMIESRVVAYYFHGEVRCPTCKRIEAYTREALQSSFAAELAGGMIGFRSVNLDEPGNEHFVTDFDLSNRTVVLAREGTGQAPNWRRLDRVWELVGDKQAFSNYVTGETRAILGAAH